MLDWPCPWLHIWTSAERILLLRLPPERDSCWKHVKSGVCICLEIASMFEKNKHNTARKSFQPFSLSSGCWSTILGMDLESFKLLKFFTFAPAQTKQTNTRTESMSGPILHLKMVVDRFGNESAELSLLWFSSPENHSSKWALGGMAYFSPSQRKWCDTQLDPLTHTRYRSEKVNKIFSLGKLLFL